MIFQKAAMLSFRSDLSPSTEVSSVPLNLDSVATSDEEDEVITSVKTKLLAANSPSLNDSKVSNGETQGWSILKHFPVSPDIVSTVAEKRDDMVENHFPLGHFIIVYMLILTFGVSGSLFVFCVTCSVISFAIIIGV